MKDKQMKKGAMHFVEYPHNGKFEDLAHYNKNSLEGILNKRNKALAALEELGVFPFARLIGSVQIDTGEAGMRGLRRYSIYSYKKSDEKDLLQVSTKFKLIKQSGQDNEFIRVRVHDTQRMIYILDTDSSCSFECREIYKLKPVYRTD